MSAADAAERGRRLIESQMRSTCTISQPGDGERVWDAATGTYTDPQRAVVYSGPCRVKPASTWGRTTNAGEAQVTPSTFQVAIPFAAPGSESVRQGMEIVVDTSPDAALPGRKFEIRFTPDMGDDITARRLLCEEMA